MSTYASSSLGYDANTEDSAEMEANEHYWHV